MADRNAKGARRFASRRNTMFDIDKLRAIIGGALIAVAGLVSLSDAALAQATTPDLTVKPPAAVESTPLPPAAPPAASAPEAPQDLNKPSGDASTGFGLVLEARPVVMLQGTSSWDEGYQHLMEAFQSLHAQADKVGLKIVGRPMTAFVETDDAGFHYQAMLPVDKVPANLAGLEPAITIAQSPAGKALKFQHRGAYDDIDSTYEAITAYLDEKGLEAQNLFVEEYLNEAKSSDDTGLEVDIYVFVK
jgi:effector-binding domain-containing protein